MTPQFLRAEAARFREMADTAEREASKLRLLAMATDYETRADAAGPSATSANAAGDAPSDPAPAEPVKVRIGRKITLERKDPD